MKKDLPVFEMVIDEDLSGESEVSAVALVDYPAIQKDFIAFSKHEEADKYTVRIGFDMAAISQEEHKVFGPLMLANLPIYRNFDGQECYVTFSKETIDLMAQKFFQKGYQASVNLMHDPEQTVSDVTMFQSWLVNRDMGMMPMKGYEDAADGSWFSGFKVNNPDVWEKIKSGEVKGFSIEGTFGMKPQRMKEDDILQQLKEILSCVED